MSPLRFEERHAAILAKPLVSASTEAAKRLDPPNSGQELELGPFRFGFVVVGLGDLESESLEVADDVLPSS